MVRPYGALGAVFGTISAELVVLIVELIGIRKEMNFIGLITKNIFYFLDAVLMFMAVRLVAGLYIPHTAVKLLLMIATGGVVFITLAVIYWRINKNSAFHLYATDLKKLIRDRQKGENDE